MAIPTENLRAKTIYCIKNNIKDDKEISRLSYTVGKLDEKYLQAPALGAGLSYYLNTMGDFYRASDLCGGLTEDDASIVDKTKEERIERANIFFGKGQDNYIERLTALCKDYLKG